MRRSLVTEDELQRLGVCPQLHEIARRPFRPVGRKVVAAPSLITREKVERAKAWHRVVDRPLLATAMFHYLPLPSRIVSESNLGHRAARGRRWRELRCVDATKLPRPAPAR